MYASGSYIVTRAVRIHTVQKFACAGSAFEAELDATCRFCFIAIMEALIQTGTRWRVPVPPEKRFFICSIRGSRAGSTNTRKEE